MGLSNNSALMKEIQKSLNRHKITYFHRLDIYRDLIEAFRNEGCYVLHECLNNDIAYDVAYAPYYAEEQLYEEVCN